MQCSSFFVEIDENMKNFSCCADSYVDSLCSNFMIFVGIICKGYRILTKKKILEKYHVGTCT